MEEDSDLAIERANTAYQASRAACRERQLREREAKRSATDGLLSNTPSAAASAQPSPPPPNDEIPKAVASGLSALGIDRARLERERLARQAKRSGSGSAQLEAGPVVPGPANIQPIASTRLSSHPLQSKGPFPFDAGGEYHLDGELRHVRLLVGSCSTTDDTFSPQNVFGKVSSAFQHVINVLSRTKSRSSSCQRTAGTPTGSSRSCRSPSPVRRSGSSGLPLTTHLSGGEWRAS